MNAARLKAALWLIAAIVAMFLGASDWPVPLFLAFAEAWLIADYVTERVAS
jgi:hypothetical protein